MPNRFNQRTSPLRTPYRDWFVDNVACPTCGKGVSERCVMVQFAHLVRAGLRAYPFPTTTHKRRKDVAKVLFLIADKTPQERFPELLDLATA